MRTVIVTGGAYGIGRAIVRRFAAEGDAVAIVDIDRNRGSALENELKSQGAAALFIECDIRAEEAVIGMVHVVVNNWDRVDVLVNNAGVEVYQKADEYTLHDWALVIDTNLRGPWLCAKQAVPALRQSHGCIVNISSIQGIACEPGIAPYAASKAGLMALTRGMALDFAGDGVRVNAVCPGAVHTGMMEKYLEKESNPGTLLDRMAQAIPLGRVAQPEDIAGAVLFLASPDAAYITGASLVVDGGVMARHAL